MTLSDLYADLTAQFFLSSDYFAESVKYTPAGGEAVTISADVGEETVEQTDRDGKRVIQRRRQFTVSTDPTLDCGGVAAPDGLVAGKFTYPASGGREYSVDQVNYISETEKIAQVEAVAVDETGQVGPRPGLRSGPRW